LNFTFDIRLLSFDHLPLQMHLSILLLLLNVSSSPISCILCAESDIESQVAIQHPRNQGQPPLVVKGISVKGPSPSFLSIPPPANSFKEVEAEAAENNLTLEEIAANDEADREADRIRKEEEKIKRKEEEDIRKAIEAADREEAAARKVLARILI
jgi:hypothetical protein